MLCLQFEPSTSAPSKHSYAACLRVARHPVLPCKAPSAGSKEMPADLLQRNTDLGHTIVWQFGAIAAG